MTKAIKNLLIFLVMITLIKNCVLLEKSRKRKDINLTTKTQINLLIDEIYEILKR